MNNFFSYLRLLLLATSGMLLLCIIFAMNPELADGTLSGKICWFHFTSLLLAGGVLLMEFTTKMHIPADTRSAFPVISVHSPVSIQCRWQS